MGPEKSFSGVPERIRLSSLLLLGDGPHGLLRSLPAWTELSKLGFLPLPLRAYVSLQGCCHQAPQWRVGVGMCLKQQRSSVSQSTGCTSEVKVSAGLVSSSGWSFPNGRFAPSFWGFAGDRRRSWLPGASPGPLCARGALLVCMAMSQFPLVIRVPAILN